MHSSSGTRKITVVKYLAVLVPAPDHRVRAVGEVSPPKSVRHGDNRDAENKTVHKNKQQVFYIVIHGPPTIVLPALCTPATPVAALSLAGSSGDA